MELTRDRVRNITLTVLVLLSFFLSFKLWTAGRNINEEQNTSSQTIRSNISVIDHKESEIFRPILVALHEAQAQQPLKMANIYPLKNLWENQYSFKNLERIDSFEQIEMGDYISRIQTGRWLEFIFAEELPIGIFSKKFAELPPENANYFFDRVLVNLDDQSHLHFYHLQTSTFYSAKVLEGKTLNTEPFSNPENLIYKPAEVRVLAKNFVYLLQDPVELPVKSYVVDRLPNSVYTSNFYPDPSLVDVRSGESITRYIDLTREVTINSNTHTLLFLRQIEDRDELPPTERFLKSFEQINRFENWTSTYSLADYNRENQILSFRREIDGLPVFSRSDNETISEIGLVESGVTHLKLPLRFINTPINIDDSSSEELASGVAVLNLLLRQLTPEAFDQVENLKIGYTWQESVETSQVIYFIPDWYILFDGSWVELDTLLAAQEAVDDGF